MGSRKMEMIGVSKLEDKLMSDFNDDFKSLKGKWVLEKQNISDCN